MKFHKVLAITVLLLQNTPLYAAENYLITMTPINGNEMRRAIHSPQTTSEQHDILIRRAKNSHLLEEAVADYRVEVRTRPKDKTLASAFLMAYSNQRYLNDFYKPGNPKLWQQEKNDMDLYRSAEAVAKEAPPRQAQQGWFYWMSHGFYHSFVDNWEPDESQPGHHVKSNISQGRDELRKAIQINPTSVSAHQWLAAADLIEDEGYNPQEALQEAQSAIRLCRRLPSSYELESDAYSGLKDYKAAYAALQQASALTLLIYKAEINYQQRLAVVKHLAETH